MNELPRTQKNLKLLNRLLSGVVFFLAIYIMTMPFLPELELIWNRRQDHTAGYVYQSSAAEAAGVAESELQPPPADNRLVIPAINVDSAVLEGDDISILNNGQAWRRPHTSNPETGGNTVIVAHRYFGQGKNTFYHLNKLKSGDELVVYWEGKEYRYQVFETFITHPNDISVEEASEDDILTLYTCNGLSAENRFIVKAKLLTT